MPHHFLFSDPCPDMVDGPCEHALQAREALLFWRGVGIGCALSVLLWGILGALYLLALHAWR